MVIMSEREFDFIIYGGTGVTGKYVLRNLVKWLELEKKPRWIAIAGSNKARLQVALTEIAIQMDRNLNDVGLIVADLNDEASLLSMCARSKVLLNAFGLLSVQQREKLAKACIEKRTHMLDISDEPDYIELLQLKYHEAAKSAGVYLICSIDFNCVPIDIGVDFLKQQFLPAGRLDSVESYISFQPNNHHHHHRHYHNTISHQPQLTSFLINPILQPNHYSDALMVSDASKRSQWLQHPASSTITTQSSLSSSSTSSDQYFKPVSVSVSSFKSLRSLFKCLPRKNAELSSWSIPISTHNIVWRSQKWFYEAYREPPTRFEQHLIVSQWYQLIFIVLTLLYLTLLTWFSVTRKLLSSYPNALTFGLLNNNNSTHNNTNSDESRYSNYDSNNNSVPSKVSSSFSIHLVGRGWDSPSDSSDGQYKFPPNRTIRVSIDGSESGCETTSLILIQCALTILEESSSMPYKGGCLTPAFAFRYTSLRDRLNQRGLQFKILHH